MTASEALRRILAVHWPVVFLLAVAGISLGFVIHLHDQTMYAASTRLTLDTRDAQSSTESRAIADGARAIVTSRAKVAGGLRAIGATRNPDDMAANDITLNPVGTSDVLELTVTDRDPRVAVALANNLAQSLIQARLQASQRESSVERNQQISALTARIKQIDADLATVEKAMQSASPADVAVLSGRVDTLNSERATLTQQQLAFEAQANALPYPLIVSPAAAHALSSRRPLDMALGLMLGLVAGVAVAGLLEVLRPTVASPAAIAEEVGAPLLADLRARGGLSADDRLDRLGAVLHTAMQGAEVRMVELMAAGPPVGLGPLAIQLARRLPPHEAQFDEGARPVVEVFKAGVNGSRPARVGLVLVAPAVVKRFQLRSAVSFASLARQQLIGVVTYRPGRFDQEIAAAATPPLPWDRSSTGGGSRHSVLPGMGRSRR